jgi:hypothetical protein
MKALEVLRFVAIASCIISIPPILYLDVRMRRLLREYEPDTFTRIGSPRALVFGSSNPNAALRYIRGAEFRASANAEIRETGEWLLRLQYVLFGGFCIFILVGLERIVVGS